MFTRPELSILTHLLLLLKYNTVNKFKIYRGDFVLGGFCPGGIFVLGDFVLRGFCPGDFVQGDFVRGDFVLIPPESQARFLPKTPFSYNY